MGKKPTYEELEQRVDGLEKKARERARLGDRMQLLSLAVEQSSEGIAVVDLDGNLEYLNGAFARMHGYSVKELIGKNLSILHTPQQMPSVEAANRQIKKTGNFKGEIWHVTRNGTEFPTLMHNSLLRDDTGNPIGIIGTLREITDLKGKEAEIKASEVRFRELFDYMSSGVAVYAAKDNGNDFIFKDFNRAGERIENVKKENLLGKSVLEMFPGVKEFGLFDVFKRVWETGKPEYHPVTLYKDNRITGWRENYIYKLPSGEIVAAYDDVTEHKQTKKALQKSENKYRTLLENIPQKIFSKDKELVYVSCNENFARDLKIKSEEVAGKTDYDFFQKELAEKYRTDDKRIMKSGKTEDIEEKYIQNGREVIVHTVKTPAKDEQGNTVGILGIFHDITDRKQAEEALRESEEKYRTLLETTSEGCWLINSERKTIEVNQALCNMLGYSQDEMIGKTPFDFVDDENRKIFIEQTSKIPDTTHRSYEITLKKKNGENLYTYFNATTIRDKSGAVQGSFAFVADITERKQTQEERDRLAVAIEQAAESVFITDRNGTIQYVNPAFERLTGYSSEDAVGQNPRILKSGKHDALFYKQMWDTLTRGIAWHGRFINRKKDGSFYEAEATISPVLDKSGKITNFVSIKRDVTREIELEKRLSQAQKIESIGILAGGIAHDFNNLLTIILGNIELAEDDIKPEVGISECLAEAEKASIQAQALTKQIITFAKGGAPVKKIGSIGNLVKETTDYSLSGSNVKCDFLILHDLWPVEFDEGQMKHAIKNIIDNAVESMPDEGTIHVRAENFNITAEQGLPLLEGKYVKISIRDHGVGIPEKHLSEIFDPYFSTKEMGIQKGMGLGLATTYSIINRHDGYITMESEVGVGTTFTLFLPAHEKEIKLTVS